jgi:signal transduction histidine kinase
MRTLRSRLILSHILPLLLITPLIGIVLIYLVETQVLLSNLSNELAEIATSTAELAGNQPNTLASPADAQRFLTQISTQGRLQIMLLDRQGNLLASTEIENAGQIGQPLELADFPSALAGGRPTQVTYNLTLQAEVIEVLAPVVAANEEIVGVVRLSRQLSDVHDQFLTLRYLIMGVLAVALLFGVIIGLILALNLERPLRQLSEAFYGVASGRQWKTLPEHGPEEIQLLVRAFNTLVERLRVLEEARRHLLANLVHEIGRPVGALQAAIEALLSGAEQDPGLRHELLEGMHEQTKRLQPLLDNLAELYSQVLGTFELNVQSLNLNNWLHRTVSPWREAALAKGLHWQIDIPDTLPEIEIDPDRLAQVLGNLLSNAIKYTPEGTISVEARPQDEGIAIVVSDTGLGITLDEQAQIFEPFYRSQRNKRFPQGMGLGLSIARDLVVAHGGSLTVESTSEQGSRFIIWLPRQVSPVEFKGKK